VGILSSQASLADLRDLFASPSPLTSTLCGLLTLIAAGAIYAAFDLRRGHKLKKKAGESGWDRFIVWSRKVDHAIVDKRRCLHLSNSGVAPNSYSRLG
jgi:hypothetical protein